MKDQGLKSFEYKNKSNFGLSVQDYQNTIKTINDYCDSKIKQLFDCEEIPYELWDDEEWVKNFLNQDGFMISKYPGNTIDVEYWIIAINSIFRNHRECYDEVVKALLINKTTTNQRTEELEFGKAICERTGFCDVLKTQYEYLIKNHNKKLDELKNLESVELTSKIREKIKRTKFDIEYYIEQIDDVKNLLKENDVEL